MYIQVKGLWIPKMCAHARLRWVQPNRDFAVNAQRADAQMTVAPVFRHLQTAHAFAQPPYPAARGADDLLHHFAINLGQITRRPSVLQQAT
jgi:hypothetical protein